MGLSNWPSVVDDDGSLTLGTVFNKAFFDAVRASVEADLFSAVNPAVTAENVIDEVVAARGSKASLDARLDEALNEDGTLKTQASLVTTTDAGSTPQTNVVCNETFLIWPTSDTAVPSYWAIAGTGALIQRCGTALADTAQKVGDFCARLTYGTTPLTFFNDILPTAAFSKVLHLRSTMCGFGAWVKAAAGAQTRLYMTDGVSTTYTSYHTGDGTWQWLSSIHTVSNTGTHLAIGISVESGAANPAYLSGPTVILGNIAPSGWRPCPTAYGTLYFPVPGVQAAGTVKGYYMPNRPLIVRHIQCILRTAPTGATTFKVDVNKDNATMLASVIAFTASDKCAGKAPDGTYAQYCFAGATNNSGVTITGELTFDIDAIGSTIAGSDLMVAIRAQMYLDPFEHLKAV